MLRSLAALSLALILVAAASAQEFQGAESALRQAAARKAKEKESGPGLLQQARAFGSGRGLSPEAAARGWLALFDRLPKVPDGMPASFGTLVGALPAPESWNAIADGLTSRVAGKPGLSPVSIRLFAALLKGDAAAERSALHAVSVASKGSPAAAEFSSQIAAIDAALAGATGDGSRMVTAFVASLAVKSRGNESVVVPDLVSIVGPEKAEALLIRAMTTTSKTLNVGGKATRVLAQRVALAHVKTIKVPQWSLVDASETKLYEGMAARFGAATSVKEQGDDAAVRAHYNYTLGLVGEGRRSEAVKVARSLRGSLYFGEIDPESVLGRLMGTHEFTAFLSEAAEGNPDSPFWDLYIASAARSRESGAVVASLQRTLASPRANPQNRAVLLGRLSTALFAADRVDEGLAVLKKSISAPGSEGAEMQAVTYAKVGALIGRPAVVEEGVALAKAIENRPVDPHSGMPFGEVGLSELLIDLGRPAEAERVAIDAYVRTAPTSDESISYGGRPNPALVALAHLYYRLNRPADVRTLLDQAPDWGVRDALDLAQSRYGFGGEGDPVGFVAAWALAKTGERPAAEIVLNRVLAAHGGYDPAYALLLEIKGADAIPRLDALYATDQFEERPLIWKAVTLKDLGRLNEAETTVRKAIAVDPSDGETHGGHRLYAYAVLADIQEAKGDDKSATESRNAVTAIRMAEKADELAEVGLLGRAIAGYEASTQRFSDAYCIQSRLAVDLMEQGREKEAEEHYRRAYELMPSSFGRVETHCLGCEHVFEGDIAQNIAERVFTAFEKKTPEKPQVHYLLGYLRAEQGRFAEAMAEYRKAVALDPDYLNAWKQLSEMEARVPTGSAERRSTADAIARLDPLQKHGSEIPTGDLRALWRRVDTALAALGAEGPTSAYKLSATTMAMAQKPNEAMAAMSEMEEAYEGFGIAGVRSPGDALRRTTIVQSVVQLIDNSRGNEGAAFEESVVTGH